MNDEQTVPTYQKGFNDGYIITAYEPTLADQLAGVASQSTRMEGFREGRKQCVLEQTKSQRPGWLKGHEKQAEDNGIAKEQGRDRDE